MSVNKQPTTTFGWVCCCTHPKVMTGNGQLTCGAFIINDFLRNPHLIIISCKASFHSGEQEIKRTLSFYPKTHKKVCYMDQIWPKTKVLKTHQSTKIKNYISV